MNNKPVLILNQRYKDIQTLLIPFIGSITTKETLDELSITAQEYQRALIRIGELFFPKGDSPLQSKPRYKKIVSKRDPERYDAAETIIEYEFNFLFRDNAQFIFNRIIEDGAGKRSMHDPYFQKNNKFITLFFNHLILLIHKDQFEEQRFELPPAPKPVQYEGIGILDKSTNTFHPCEYGHHIILAAKIITENQYDSWFAITNAINEGKLDKLKINNRMNELLFVHGASLTQSDMHRYISGRSAAEVPKIKKILQ